MTEYSTLIFDGGVYRIDELIELIEDVGGFVIRREDFGVSTILVFLIPKDDEGIMEEKAEELKGVIKRAPLAGSEISVIAPSTSRRHLPHPTCDIAEFLRRYGAQTNLIGLARGVGQEAFLTYEEEELINEHDLALFVLGNSEYCLVEKKPKLYKSLKVPVVVVGGPYIKDVPYARAYVGGFGRRASRMKSSTDIKRLEKLVEVIEKCLDKRRAEIAKDPSLIPPIVVKEAIESQIPDVRYVISPSPITLQLNGLRVKLPYDTYVNRILNVKIEGSPLRNFVTPIKSGDHILIKMNPK